MRSMYLKILVLLFVFSFVGCSEDSEIEDSIINSTNVLSENSNRWTKPTESVFIVEYDYWLSFEQIKLIRSEYFSNCIENPIMICGHPFSIKLGNEIPNNLYIEFWELTDCIEPNRSINFSDGCPGGLLRDIQDELGVANVIH